MSGKNKEYRAIYLYDIEYQKMPIFKYCPKTKNFYMVEDSEFCYPLERVLKDKDFLIFEINKNQQKEWGSEVRQVKGIKRKWIK